MLNGSGMQNDFGVNVFIKRAENRQGRAAQGRGDVHYVSHSAASGVSAAGRALRLRRLRAAVEVVAVFLPFVASHEMFDLQ